MTTRLDATTPGNNEKAPDSENSPANSADIVRRYAECPGCAKRMLLFSQTIQTFCFQCGTPVAALDARNMYYLPLKPVAAPEEANEG